MLSAFCSLVLITSVFSLTAYATTTMSNWFRFTQGMQGFTLTGEGQEVITFGTHRTHTSRARGLSIVRCASAQAGLRTACMRFYWGLWQPRGVISERTNGGSGWIAVRQLRFH